MKDAKKPKSKRKWLWIVAGISGGLLLLVLIAALAVAALLFGGGREFPVDPLRPEDYALVGKLTGRLLTELRTGKPADSELVLTPKEVESVLRLADNGVSLGAMPKRATPPKPKWHSFRYENGRFELVAPVETGVDWLWGGIIMVETSVRPEKEDETFTLNVSRFKAGSITLPDFIVKRMRERSLEDFRNRKEYRQFDRCVKSIRIDGEDNLRVVYRPGELVKLLPEESRRILLPGSGRK